MMQAYKFFKANAGGIVGQCAAGALALAKAEEWAQAEEVTIEWMPDDDADEGNLCQCKECVEWRESNGMDVWGCVLTLGDESVSLWGIERPSDEYRRVVEAELAQELQTDFFTALGNHIRSL